MGREYVNANPVRALDGFKVSICDNENDLLFEVVFRPRESDEAPDRPVMLHALEMLQVAPSAVLPGPRVAFYAQDEGHDEVHERNERQQGDERVVAEAPDPVEEEGAPAPAPERWRQLGPDRPVGMRRVGYRHVGSQSGFGDEATDRQRR